MEKGIPKSILNAISENIGADEGIAIEDYVNQRPLGTMTTSIR
jgi:hypothetical protein